MRDDCNFRTPTGNKMAKSCASYHRVKHASVKEITPANVEVASHFLKVKKIKRNKKLEFVV